MNVLQIIPSLEAGGAERAVIDVAAALKRAGDKAFVISSGGRMVAELEHSGATHMTMPVASKNPLQIWANSATLKKIITQHKIDILHVRSRAPAWSCYGAARALHIPLVTTVHAAYKGNNPLKKYYNNIMGKGDAVITVSKFIADYARTQLKAPAAKINIIPRGIDFSVFNPDSVDEKRIHAFRLSCGLHTAKPLIIFPARLSPIKGQELALASLAALKNHDFDCLFIGPDQGRRVYKAKLEHLIAHYGLQNKVQLIAKTDLMAAYAASDLVLSPSQVAEGFGRVPVEAQAFGVPVIATALGATSETVLEGQTGWLVEVGNSNALTAAIEKAFALNPAQRAAWKDRAIAHVRQHFDMQKMCADTLAVYQKLYANRPL